MSSSGPGGSNRNKTCHAPDRASATTKTYFGKLGVEKSSRTAKKYESPAKISQIMNAGPPRSLKLREQIVSASSCMLPNASSLTTGARVTALPCDDALDRGPATILRTTLPFAVPLPVPAPTLAPVESDPQPHRCRRKLRSGCWKVSAPERAPVIVRARCLFQCHHSRRASGKQPSRRQDSIRRHALAQEPGWKLRESQKRVPAPRARDVGYRC